MNIAAIVKNLGPSQCNFFLVKEFNKLSEDCSNSCSVFVNNVTIPVTDPCFSCPIVTFLPQFSGSCIATSISTANQLLECTGTTKKFLYIWDLEWLNNPASYSETIKIMSNKKINLIARSNSHAGVINNFCNRDVCGIVEDWDKDQLLNIMR